MKRGDTVAVCYDGKWARKVKGEVIRQHNRHHITVRHKLYADDVIVETRFRATRRKSRRGFAGWVRTDCALMPMLFGAPGDWYRVYKWRQNDPHSRPYTPIYR